MSDERLIEQLYCDMYAAMVDKDEAELERVHDDSFVLLHMTGLRQSKREYIKAILSGVLNYYSAETESLDIRIDGNKAELRGRSRVTAAVFGSSKHTWRLELRLELKKTADGWRFILAQASTW
ncbi:nuclear transport factor 2 family protein [bacterium]|nr:nuclear transport factor 2 family protein [bacterium]